MAEEETKAEEGGNEESKDDDEPKKKKKPKKPKAKTAKSEMGGTGEYKDKTYEQILKKDIVYVDGLVNSRDPLANEEEEFVDWVLNKEEGRKLYKKYKAASQAKCMAAPCSIQ